MALTDKLVAIGDAIRSKTGSTEAMTLDAMATAITNLSSGGGGGGTLSYAQLNRTAYTGSTRTFDLTEYLAASSGTVYFITQYATTTFISVITDGVLIETRYGTNGSIAYASAASLAAPTFALADGIMTITGSGSSNLKSYAVVIYVA